MFLYKVHCAGILCLLCAPAAAQGRLDSIQRIDEVTVAASRYRETIPAQRLAGRQLEALSSASVADAVRYFAGVQLKDYGGIGGLKTLDIRSMGSNHLGVFYDGIPLGNAQNGQVDLGKFSLDNIEEITLYNGQKSEIFQSARDFGSAGSIYLRSRRPQFRDGRRTNVFARLRTGSFDLINPSVLWEQKAGKDAALSVNAEYVYSSGKYPFRYRKTLPNGITAWDTTAIRQNGDIRSLRIEGGAGGSVRRTGGHWHAKAYYYQSERGIPGAIVNNVWKHSQRQWDRNFFVQGSAKNALPMPQNAELLLNVKYASDHLRYLNPDTTLMYIDNSFRQQEIYASAACKYAISQNLDINLSTDYHYNTLAANLVNFAYPVRHTALIALASAGEWRRLKAQASVLGTFVIEDIKRSGAARPAGKTEWTPAVFVSYQPFARRNLHLRAFYKRIFRMPTFNDLYYTDIGNIKLKPEYANQYNLGVQYNVETGLIPSLQIRADAYYNEITDKIVAIPKGSGQYRWMMMNLGYVEIRGIDIGAAIETPLMASLQPRISLNYTYQRAQDCTNPQSQWYGGQIAYIPRHSGSAAANILWRGWSANYSFIYVGERYHNSANIPPNYEQPWYTHDGSISRAFVWSKVKLILSAEVNNILNQYYDVVLNYPMPGRNYKFILKLEL